MNPSATTDLGTVMNDRPVRIVSSRPSILQTFVLLLSLLTIDLLVASNSHHAVPYICLLAELHAQIREPFLVRGRADCTFGPAGSDIIDADPLLKTRSSYSSHEATQSVLGRGVFPVALVYVIRSGYMSATLPSIHSLESRSRQPYFR